MFVNNLNKKNISNAPSISVSFSTSSVLNEPFKTLKINEYLNKKAFDGMLERVFANLDSASPDALYSISDKFVYNPLKKLLKEKGKFYNDLYSKINDFYKYHPFDTEKILSQEMKDFLLEWPLENIVSVPTWVIYIKSNALEEFAAAVFVPKFLEYIQKEMNDKIGITNGYIKFGDLIKNNLRLRLENWLKSIYPFIFDWNAFPKLSSWISNFNYKNAQQLNATNIYDELFDGSLENQSTSISEDVFTNNNLKNYIDLNLNPDSKSLMKQMILYLIFDDNIRILQVFKRGGSLEDAEKLIEDIENKRDPAESLNVFLPGIKDIIKKFNLYWNFLYPNKGGLVISRVGSSPWLVSKNTSNSIFDLNFSLRFQTEADQNSKKILEHNTFKIHPIKKIVPIFDQAKNIVNDFISKITWNKGYKESYFWTEKDIIDWVDGIDDYEDLLITIFNERKLHLTKYSNNLNFVTDLNYNGAHHHKHKHIKLKKNWSNFTNANLSNMDFSLIDDDDYTFQIEAEICFLYEWHFSNNNLYLKNKFFNLANRNSIVVFLRLNQISKSNPSEPIKKTKLFLTNNPFRILSMDELVRQLVQVNLPNKITYTKWKNKGNSFWQNEFEITTPLKWTNTNKAWKDYELKYDKLFERSNINDIMNFLQPLINDINANYRDDFSIKKSAFFRKHNIDGDNRYIFLNLKWIDSAINKLPRLMTEIKREIAKIDKRQIKENLKIHITNYISEYHNDLIINSKTTLFFDHLSFVSINDLKKFGFARGSVDQLLIDWILNRIRPVSSGANLQVNSDLPDNYMFVRDDGKTFPFIDIISEFKRDTGIKNVNISKIKPGNSNTSNKKYIDISYTIKYHNFFTQTDLEFHRVFSILVEHSFVSPSQLQKEYDTVIDHLDKYQKKNKNLRNAIDNIFEVLKDPKTNTWSKTVSEASLKDVLAKVYDLITNFSEGVDILEKLNKLYDGNVPKRIIEKLLDPAYADVFRKILEQQDNFSKEKIKEILANDKLLTFLKNLQIEKLQQTIIDILKFKNNTKYAYFGTGVGLGIAGLLSSGASLKWMRLNSRSKKIQTNFSKNKYISIVAAAASIISLSASVIVMLIFFVSKGGF